MMMRPGQSNPTYLLQSRRKAAHKLVLRKQPPVGAGNCGITAHPRQGQLLESAHRVDREWTVLRALEGYVPVPRVYAACDDPKILGTAFYIMQFLDGTVHTVRAC